MLRYQTKRNNTLEARVVELKQENAALKKHIADLEGDIQSYIFSSNAWQLLAENMFERNKPQAH